ncbi:MAG: PadR family transcriptional regulator [Lachnospiraceae bacterium]|nr:PadR family transcriptional regulator [Lachnospiraceae bacterium]
MAIDRSLISGSTAMLLLRLLEDKDMYGYEMIETLEKKSNNVFSLKAGTLYPLLHSLEEKSYLTSYESPVKGKLRKYYSITKDGRKYLKLRKEEWQEYQTAVLNVLWTGLTFAG